MASSTSRSEIDDERCFFGKITSEKANEILKKEGNEDGTYLIRESCSSPGNYVLSFINEGLPIHILIQKYKEDAFFSLVLEDEPPVFHGLDKLIAHYSLHPVGTSSTTLRQPCPGDQLPPELRLHGTSSLLHRSTSQGNIVIVQELLKSGYKKIDERNSSGQTALHIASMKGYVEIVKILLQSLAFVEVRDEEGVTPLHLACRHNHAAIVRLLVEGSQADIQARASVTGAVALHEAAEHNSEASIRVLLALGAPTCPRNSQLETPLDLANKLGHTKCYSMLVNHQPPVPRFQLHHYYHGPIDRVQAQERLMASSKRTCGTFLLRQSSRKNQIYVLVVLYELQVYNYEVTTEHELFCIDDGPQFTCLETMVDHYVHFADGLPGQLTTPLPPPQASPHHTLPSRYGQVLINKAGGPSVDSLTPSSSRNNLKPSPELLTKSQHLPGSSQDLRLSSKRERGKCEGSEPSSSDLQPLLSSLSQEDLMAASTNTQASKSAPKPDIIITKSASQLSKDLIDLGEPSAATEQSGVPVSSSRAQLPSRDSLKLDLQMLNINNNADTTTLSGSSPTMDGNRTDEILGEIDINKLLVGQPLGIGEFGSVLQGMWLSPSGDKIDVAVKTLHNDDLVNKRNFLKEAEVMMNLNHLYIVKLVGVCHGPPVAMVQELMAMGSLLDFLLEHPDQITVDFHLKLWAAQIAEGMLYLEQKHFVHRDLAARNILLSSLTLAKISDFGLSRALGVDKDYYTAKDGGKWPLKWYAPESIYYGTFTSSSDVWSYGITLWEMYTFGDQPYGELPGQQVVQLLEKDERLPLPDKCPKGVYELMLRCWNFKPQRRPSFRELATIFRTSREYTNIKPYFK